MSDDLLARMLRFHIVNETAARLWNNPDPAVRKVWDRYRTDLARLVLGQITYDDLTTVNKILFSLSAEILKTDS